jgi:hypothetical protein
MMINTKIPDYAIPTRAFTLKERLYTAITPINAQIYDKALVLKIYVDVALDEPISVDWRLLHHLISVLTSDCVQATAFGVIIIRATQLDANVFQVEIIDTRYNINQFAPTEATRKNPEPFRKFSESSDFCGVKVRLDRSRGSGATFSFSLPYQRMNRFAA